MNRNVEIAKKKGYIIDSNGTVTSPKGNKVGTKGKSPYLYFGLRENGKILKVYIHRFQAFKKFGEKIFEKGIEVRHLNGIPTDNSWDNIRKYGRVVKCNGL